MTNETYRYLGYGVTDSNGVAKLDHDAEGQEISHSYTGVGAGEIDVLASLDKPIVDGSIVSEPCNVWDCIYKDCGDNDKWWITDTTNGSRTASDGNITLSYSSSSYALFYIYTGTLPSSWADRLATATIFDSPFAVEFNIVSISDNTNIGYRVENNSTNAQTTGNYLGWENGKHIKMEFTGSKIYHYVDGVKQSRESDYVFTDSRFCFRLNENTEFKIKEFKAYPI